MFEKNTDQKVFIWMSIKNTARGRRRYSRQGRPARASGRNNGGSTTVSAIVLSRTDRLVLSFRLRGRSSSSLFKKSLSDRKGAGTSQGQKKHTFSFQTDLEKNETI